MHRKLPLLPIVLVILNLMFLIQSHLSQAATSEKRVALVIGNSAYQNTPPLANPRNDATEIAKALKRIGFDVDVVVDAKKTEMDQALRRFGNSLDGSSAAVFFYAGHGIQVDGINFILPVDASLKNERDLNWDAFDLTIVLKQMEGRNRVNLVFLDACRDNPMSQTLARSMGESRSSAIGRGLAQMKANAGTLISYSTKEGEVAADGTGKHSPYTEALLKHIEMPGVEIGLMLRKVREEVITTTKNRQVPWEYGSLLGEFYFIGPVTIRAQPEGDKSSAGSKIEALYWESIMNETDPDIFEDYLKKFPSGAFREIAKRKIDKLSKGNSKPSLVDVHPQSDQTKLPPVNIVQQSDQTKPPPVNIVQQSDRTKLTGRLKVTSDPPGAEIYLDDKYMGLTPADLVDVPVGTYTLVLKKDDFDEWTDTVTVKAGKTVSVNDENNPLVTEQSSVEPPLNVESTPPGTQIRDQNQKITQQTKADTPTTEKGSVKADRQNSDINTQPVPAKKTLPVDKNPHAGFSDNIGWSESTPDTEIDGEKIPPGTQILYTATGHERKSIVGFKDGIVFGWNACGKPAVWVRDTLFEDGLAWEDRLAVRTAVFRDKAEEAGFYYTLDNRWKGIFSHNSYPNSTEKLQIEPGMTLKEALASEKCRQPPIEKK